MIIVPLQELFGRVMESHESFTNEQLGKDVYINDMQMLQPLIAKLDRQAIDVGGGPVECKDFHQKFMEVLAHAGNTVLYFAENLLEMYPELNRTYLVNQQRECNKEKLPLLK